MGSGNVLAWREDQQIVDAEDERRIELRVVLEVCLLCGVRGDCPVDAGRRSCAGFGKNAGCQQDQEKDGGNARHVKGSTPIVGGLQAVWREDLGVQ